VASQPPPCIACCNGSSTRWKRWCAARERTQWQSELAASLLDLQQSLDTSASGEALRRRLADFTRSMLAADSAAAPPAALQNFQSTEE
jgi:hypothetical protein